MTADLKAAMASAQPVRVSPGAARATLAALQARWGYRPCDDSATPEVVTIRSMAVSTWRRISGRGQSAVYECTETRNEVVP